MSELRRRAEAAGRDPQSLTVSLFSCPPTEEAVAAVERMGIERVIFGLPCRSPDEVWPVLDQFAKLIH